MWRSIFILLLVISIPVQANPWFNGSPAYSDEASETLAKEVLAAHGGMQPMASATSLQFNFFTKVIGGPMPFYSYEAVDLTTGDAYIEWPFWDATVALQDGKLWAHQWPMPMPAGFFIRLTTSFITLPWQIQADSANVGPATTGRLPEDEIVYDVLRVTFDERTPSIPGTFYDIYIDPETRLMKGVRFDINHPGMVANPEQPLGPNFHVFGEYRKFSDLILPTFYTSYGRGSADGGESNAYHFAWNVSLDQEFDAAKLNAPDDAVPDTVSMDWWQSTAQHPKASITGVEENDLAGDR